ITRWITLTCCPKRWILFWRRPSIATELQAHPQATVLVDRQGTTRHADAPGEPLPWPLETPDHRYRQRQTVGTQLDRLPAFTPTPERPTGFIMPQTAPRAFRAEQNMPRDDPAGVSETEQQPKALQPERH